MPASRVCPSRRAPGIRHCFRFGRSTARSGDRRPPPSIGRASTRSAPDSLQELGDHGAAHAQSIIGGIDLRGFVRLRCSHGGYPGAGFRFLKAGRTTARRRSGGHLRGQGLAQRPTGCSEEQSPAAGTPPPFSLTASCRGQHDGPECIRLIQAGGGFAAQTGGTWTNGSHRVSSAHVADGAGSRVKSIGVSSAAVGGRRGADRVGCVDAIVCRVI